MKEELKDLEAVLEGAKDLLLKMVEIQENKLKILLQDPEKKVAAAKALNQLNTRKKKK